MLGWKFIFYIFVALNRVIQLRFLSIRDCDRARSEIRTRLRIRARLEINSGRSK